MSDNVSDTDTSPLGIFSDDGQGVKTDGQDADTTLATEKLKPAAEITFDRENSDRQQTEQSTDQINVVSTRQNT